MNHNEDLRVVAVVVGCFRYSCSRGGEGRRLSIRNRDTRYIYLVVNGSIAMLAAKRSAGVAPEVNSREHVICTPLPSANKAAHSGFEIQIEKEFTEFREFRESDNH